MPRTERQANQALADTIARNQPTIGRNFATPGVVRTYRKPSLFARFVSLFA